MSDKALPTPRWFWEEVNPEHSGSSGDLAKLFRNDSVKEPGVMARNAPPRNVTVMAREVIQNAWDAALEWQRDRARSSGSYPPPRF